MVDLVKAIRLANREIPDPLSRWEGMEVALAFQQPACPWVSRNQFSR